MNTLQQRAVAWQEAAQHNIQISFNTLMLNQPGEAALALAADLAQFAAATAALENCSVRCSACGKALRWPPASSGWPVGRTHSYSNLACHS